MAGRSRTRARLAVAMGAVAVVVAIVAGVRVVSADRAARAGKDALFRAEAAIRERDIEGARRELVEGRRSFRRARDQLASLGPLGTVLRAIPLVRVQLRGAEAFADSGIDLATAGLAVVAAAEELIEPSDPDARLSQALAHLRVVEVRTRQGVAAIERAQDRIEALDGYRLLGPLDRTRRDLRDRLPEAVERSKAAADGLRALVVFAGGAGPRRYLVFSQNPDEVRPTGGYMGTFGVLTADEAEIALERYSGVERWSDEHPAAVIPPDQAPVAFRIPDPPAPQRLGNSNAVASWREATRVALDLWSRGGEPPADGALSFTPAFLARLLRVLGPVELRAYGETITADNLIERLDHHTHLEGRPDDVDERKRFIEDLAPVVLGRILDAPAPAWQAIGDAFGEGFARREAMAWTSDAIVNDQLAARRWDGTLPVVHGDFFHQAEFEYARKNGRGLRRTFEHTVSLHQDGSAQVQTRVTIANTRPFTADGLVNIDSAAYITVYGPEGARLRRDADPPTMVESPLAGHPAAAWFRAAPPLGEATFTVAWDVPRMLLSRADGALEYHLWWLPIPAHTGDVLHLDVRPPEGWRWLGAQPPSSVELDEELRGRWVLVRADGGD